MQPYLFLIPVWFFSLAALGLGVAYGGGQPSAALYIGLGVLGVTIANALMSHHRRIAELEKKLKHAAGADPGR